LFYLLGRFLKICYNIFAIKVGLFTLNKEK
jgi:hypothetical protein